MLKKNLNDKLITNFVLMKQFIHKSIAVFMAAVVLLTTMSFALDMHYCGDKLVDFSFVHQVETCGMEKMQEPSSCENSLLSKKSCCTDKQIVNQGTEDLKVSFEQITFEEQVFITAFVCSYSYLFETTESKVILLVDYPPPFLKRNVQVLHQTFLI